MVSPRATEAADHAIRTPRRRSATVVERCPTNRKLDGLLYPSPPVRNSPLGELRLRDRRCLAVTNDPLFEIQKNGYCVLESHFSQDLMGACREGFWPIVLDYLDAHREAPNRGPHRHFLPMPFTPPCFAPEFFFN